MDIQLVTLSEFGLKPAGELMARAFADYLVKIPASEAMLWAMGRGDSVDYTLSRVALLDGEPAGAGLVARRGWTCRLAGMALVPEARRRGVGRALVNHLVNEARERGDRQFVLEVIEQNAPAVKLYEATGFEKLRRLVGFVGRGVGAGDASGATLQEVDLRQLAAAVMATQPADWPWQLSGETMAQLAPPHAGFFLNGAWLALSNLASASVAVRGLVVEGQADQAARAAAILRAAMARFPGKDWRISALWPEENAAWFEQAGMARQPMTQWQMVRTLGRAGG